MVALKSLLVALALAITSVAAGPCKATTTPPSNAICDVQGATFIDLNTGGPPTLIQRTYTDTEAECLDLCRQDSQCLLVGYSDSTTCILLAGTPAEATFYETTSSTLFFFERICLGE
jgi:hypothetical protein